MIHDNIKGKKKKTTHWSLLEDTSDPIHYLEDKQIKEASIYPFAPLKTALWANQILCEKTFYFVKEFQLMNADRITEYK